MLLRRAGAVGFRQLGSRAAAPQAALVMPVAQKRLFAGTFGSPRDHEPVWIENWMKNTRQGKDSLDWFFRAFNSTRIYEFCLKSSPRYYGFMVIGAIFGGYYWSRMWDELWCRINKGKLYKDAPYVYPPEEED